MLKALVVGTLLLVDPVASRISFIERSRLDIYDITDISNVYHTPPDIQVDPLVKRVEGIFDTYLNKAQWVAREYEIKIVDLESAVLAVLQAQPYFQKLPENEQDYLLMYLIMEKDPIDSARIWNKEAANP